MSTDKLAEWFRLSAELKSIQEKEAVLRKEVFATFFPNPREGTNTAVLADGHTLRATYKLTRSIDADALPPVLEQLGQGSREFLLKTKIGLNMGAYRKLTRDQQNIMDSALVIKPGTPSMKIVPPKL